MLKKRWEEMLMKRTPDSFPLNETETLAMAYEQCFHKTMDYAEAMVLQEMPLPAAQIQRIRTAKYEARHQEILASFRRQFRDRLLPSDQFLEGGKDIEVKRTLRGVAIPPHRHDFTECIVVLSGTCLHTIGSTACSQEPGTVTIVPSGCLHELSCGFDAIALEIRMKKEYFSGLQIPNLPDFLYPIVFHTGEDPDLGQTALLMLRQSERDLPYQDAMLSHLFQVLLIGCMQKGKDAMEILDRGPGAERTYVQVVNYCYEHYQTVTLHEAAAHFHYSESYLCRLFRKEGELSFSQMMRDYRLRKAADLLSATRLPLSIVCEQTGFGDVTQFIRDFRKKYGTTPAKYRKKLQEETDPGIHT